jgi:hypothetical protein
MTIEMLLIWRSEMQEVEMQEVEMQEVEMQEVEMQEANLLASIIKHQTHVGWAKGTPVPITRGWLGSRAHHPFNDNDRLIASFPAAEASGRQLDRLLWCEQSPQGEHSH